MRPSLVIPAIVLLSPAASGAGPSAGLQEERMRVEGRVEKRYTIELEAPRQETWCKARIWTEYLQRNTSASVRGEIENPDCGASGGEYTIAIRLRDQEGQLRDVEHVETWQRNDTSNVTFESEYFIGEGVDLVRVRAKKIVCICADPADTGQAINGEQQ